MHGTDDRDLRARVKLLGSMLGRVLQDQERREVLDTVELLRKGFIALRQHDDPGRRRELMRVIGGLDPQTLTHVVRAFSTYFLLANIVEADQAHLERRRQVERGERLWYGSFDDSLRQLAEQGMTAQQLQALFDQLLFQPVFTAHPTEAKRRTLLEAQRRLTMLVKRLHDAGGGEVQRRAVEHQLCNNIQILWKTDEVRIYKPGVEDEIKNGLFYFRETLFDAVPLFYRNLERAVANAFAEQGGLAAVRVPSFLRFGSWIGGDRDGNPFVTHQVTRLALRLQAREALKCYRHRIEELQLLLTHSSALVRPSPAFEDRLAADDDIVDQVFAGNRDRFRQEPYRRKLYLMHHRLGTQLGRLDAQLADQPDPGPAGGYAGETDLLADLLAIRSSLYSHGDGNLAEAELQDLIRLVETFGFFLAELDIRQESERHTAAVTELFRLAPNLPDYAGLAEEERCRVLGELLSAPGTPLLYAEELSDETRELLAVMRCIAQMRREISPRAIGAYVVSMTHQASHVLEVLFLASFAGLCGRAKDGGWHCAITVAPLFETIEDLSRVEPVLERLLDLPASGPCWPLRGARRR